MRIVPKDAAGQEESNGGVPTDRVRSSKKRHLKNYFEPHFIREYSRIFEQNRIFFNVFMSCIIWTDQKMILSRFLELTKIVGIQPTYITYRYL